MEKPPNVVDVLDKYDDLVEVGVGERTAVAATLADRGRRVKATDVHECAVPEAVEFVRDDVTDPELSIYAAADAIYALNCPPELHGALVAVAERADAACFFTTLGGDQPAVPVERKTIENGTLYVARE